MVQIHTLPAECQQIARGWLLRFEHGALEIAGLRDGEHLGMVFALAEDAPQPDSPAAIPGRLGQHGEELGQTDVKGAARGDQDPSGGEAAHGAEVDLAVPAERPGHRGA